LGCNTGVISLPDVSRYQRATPTRMRGRLTRLPVHVSRRRFVMDQPDHRRCNHRLDIAIAERPAMQAQVCCDPLIRCPLLGVKRTLIGCRGMSAFDPKRTFAIQKGTKHIRGMLICSDSDSACMSVACRRSKLRVEARGAFIMSAANRCEH